MPYDMEKCRIMFALDSITRSKNITRFSDDDVKFAAYELDETFERAAVLLDRYDDGECDIYQLIKFINGPTTGG